MKSSVALLLIMLSLYCMSADASMAECQVRCPAGMMCVRVAGSHFHLCTRRTSANMTSESFSLLNAPEEGESSMEQTSVGSSPVCPTPSADSGPCVVQCRYHSDCRAHEACCSNGCGYTCVATTPDEMSKPGSCPVQSGLGGRSCGPSCRTDGDCRGSHKCCRSRCGVTCKAPCFHWLSSTRVNPWRLSHRCRQGMAQLWN